MEKLSILASDMDHERQYRWRLLVSRALIERSKHYRSQTHVQIGHLHRSGRDVANRMLELAWEEVHPGVRCPLEDFLS